MIPAEKIAAIVHATLHEQPPGETHWSCRSVARAQGVSPATVQRIWCARDLKPHRVKTFKLSNDKRFEEKLVDVVGLYLNPPLALPRHVKQRGGEVRDAPREQVARELQERGLPDITAFEQVRGAWHEWRSKRRPTDPPRTLLGLRLELAEPISGPLVLGALSHFGLGLFAAQPD